MACGTPACSWTAGAAVAVSASHAPLHAHKKLYNSHSTLSGAARVREEAGCERGGGVAACVIHCETDLRAPEADVMGGHRVCGASRSAEYLLLRRRLLTLLQRRAYCMYTTYASCGGIDIQVLEPQIPYKIDLLGNSICG